MEFLNHFFREFYSLFLQMSPYLLLGLFFSALIKLFFSDLLIEKHLGKNDFKSVLLATLFGIPLPLCSCGVVPAGLSLHRQGASEGATVAFLTATPQTGIDSISVTYGFLGLPFTLFKVLVALFSGLLSGSVVNLLERKKIQDLNNFPNFKKTNSLKEAFSFAFLELMFSLRKWLIIGLLLGALISTLIPENFFLSGKIYNNSWLFYLITLAIGVPLYVCATASIPIAVSLLNAGFPAGSALIFLIAGPATNATTLTLLWKMLGKRNTTIYLSVLILVTILAGYLFDLFFPDYILSGNAHSHDNHSSGFLSNASSLIFFILLLYSFFGDLKSIFKRKERKALTYKTLQISGISCNNCIEKIRKKLLSFKEIVSVELSLSGNCKIGFKESVLEIEKIITDLGYKVSKKTE